MIDTIIQAAGGVFVVLFSIAAIRANGGRRR